MNRMEQDLHDLGVILWPDNASLWPQGRGSWEAASRPHSRLMVAVVGTATLLIVFGLIALGLVLVHKQAPPANVASMPPVATVSATPSVTRVEVSVPGNPLTFEVARGTIIALHLQLTSYAPESAWVVDTARQPGVDFQPVEVSYPGAHPASSATNFFVAFRIPNIGTTQIVIEAPATCPISEACPTLIQVFDIRAVAPPMRTGTVTGELTLECGQANCVGPVRNGLINFRNTHG
ncbi:MAG TPA: hypothetical protein VG815_03420, partial [Chloroflexota bacterium]|nr:hypothetical protein [Chloroflexota bacterium]